MYNWAFDEVDERLYNYDEMCWNDNDLNDLKSFIILDNKDIQDQFKDWYNYWCVFYSSSQNDNYCNERDWIKDKTKWSELCEIAEQKDMWDRKSWALLINWPKLLKELWYIKGYAWCNSIELIKIALNKNEPIHCWSNKINWAKTKISKDKIAVIDKWYWHCFHIIGYNDWDTVIYWSRIIPSCVFICKDNSNNYDNWFFYLRYENFNALFTNKVVFINDIKVLDTYKKRIMEKITIEEAKKAFEEKLWNWERPQEQITREECATIVMRALNKIRAEKGV